MSSNTVLHSLQIKKVCSGGQTIGVQINFDLYNAFETVKIIVIYHSDDTFRLVKLRYSNSHYLSLYLMEMSIHGVTFVGIQ